MFFDETTIFSIKKSNSIKDPEILLIWRFYFHLLKDPMISAYLSLRLSARVLGEIHVPQSSLKGWKQSQNQDFYIFNQILQLILLRINQSESSHDILISSKNKPHIWQNYVSKAIVPVALTQLLDSMIINILCIIQYRIKDFWHVRGHPRKKLL